MTGHQSFACKPYCIARIIVHSSRNRTACTPKRAGQARPFTPLGGLPFLFLCLARSVLSCVEAMSSPLSIITITTNLKNTSFYGKQVLKPQRHATVMMEVWLIGLQRPSLADTAMYPVVVIPYQCIGHPDPAYPRSDMSYNCPWFMPCWHVLWLPHMEIAEKAVQETSGELHNTNSEPVRPWARLWCEYRGLYLGKYLPRPR